MFFYENCKYTGEFNESTFIIGLDIGNSDSTLSFFDFNTGKVQQLDISGGYGKASVPTVVQYIKDTNEWVFGEYALMNKPLSDSITFDNLIAGLGKKNCYNIKEKIVSHSYILSLFIKELIGNIKNINPNAIIIGIAACVSYLGDEAEKELLDAFLEAGYSESLIGLFSEKECILNKYCFDEKTISSKIITLDFSSREIRGSFYNLFENGDNIIVNTISTSSQNNISTDKIENKLYNIFEQYLKKNTGEINLSNIHKLQLEAFTYQHKDLIFKSSGNNIKLYFNFVYPPFQQNIEKTDIENITLEFKGAFYEFLKKIFERDDSFNSNTQNFDIQSLKVDKVICGGGGFEMSWIKQAVIDIFGKNRCIIYKNPKNVLSEGACIIAVKYFTGIAFRNIDFSEKITLTQDIGLVFRDKNGKRFVPFINKGTFWWQDFESKSVIIKQSDSTVFLEVFKRDNDGALILIDRINIDDLPKRPSGININCLDILFKYIEYNKILIKIKDLGFGEFFEKTNYEKNFFIKL